MVPIKWLLLASVLCHLAASKDSPFRWRRTKYVMPWRQGPNMCALEEVTGSRRRYYGNCLTHHAKNYCEKPTIIRYYCCNGYEKTDANERGCLGVKPVRSLIKTADHLGLFEFTSFIKEAGLEDKFSEPGPYTMFVPERRLYKDLPSSTEQLLKTDDQNKNLIRMHAAEGRYNYKDLKDGMEFPSIYNFEEEGMLKIHKYRNGIKTVNCVRMSLTDQVATNGVIHLVDGVIQPYPNEKSIMDVLMEYPDETFGELVTALIVSDLASEMRDTDGSVTLFAPTNKAFRTAPREVINRILGDKELVKKLLRYHQLPKGLCSAAVLYPYRATTNEGQKVNLSCHYNDTISVNGIPVGQPDIVTTNGVIHVIDELLIPDSVKSLSDIISELDMGKFTEYAQQAGLTEILNGEAPGNYTVFVPSPEAFEALSEDDMMRLQTDTAYVKETMKYHVVPEVLPTTEMNEGEHLETLYKAPLTSHVYQKGYGVNSAKIESANHVASNGIVHVIDRVLSPPVASAMDIIKQDPRLTTLNMLLEESGLDRRLEASNHLTLFAPSNRAFEKLSKAEVDRLKQDPQELRQALGYHVLPKQMFTSGIDQGLQYRYRTMAKSWLNVRQNEDEEVVRVNDDAVIQEPNIETTNGAIHIVDRVLKCPCVSAFDNEVGQSGNNK